MFPLEGVPLPPPREGTNIRNSRQALVNTTQSLCIVHCIVVGGGPLCIHMKGGSPPIQERAQAYSNTTQATKREATTEEEGIKHQWGTQRRQAGRIVD